MTPVALDMSQIHLGKGQGASGRHQECLHSLLENRRVVSAWVPLVHCPALSLSLSLWATFCFFVCRRWASGACSRAAGADLGPCSVLQRAAAGFHTALCYVTCPLSPACMELGHRSQLSTHCHYGNTWCYDMGGDNVLQMWGLLDREDTKTLFINIKQRK